MPELATGAGKVLILSWPHEVRRAAPGAAAADEWAVPVWDALTLLWKGHGRTYDRGFAGVLSDLQLRKVVLDARGVYWRLQPRLGGRWGWLEQGPEGVHLFNSDLCLNTDGPTVPALKMLAGLIADEKPSLVISIGLGGGVRPGDQAGDVVATTRARFGLHGELESFDGNDQEYGAGPAITEDWFDGIELPEDREPALLPMSAHVACPGSGWPQPPPHRPSIRVDSRPVLTQPSTRADLFVPAPTVQTRTDRFLGDTVAAVDMDAAIAAKACADAGVPFAAVIGISVPAIAPIPDDWEATLRDAWTEVLHQQFATAAARNAVTVTQRIVAHFHA